jgi:phosphatidylglycerophosphatase A
MPWIANVGGLGLLPLAPGTWGAAAGTLLLYPFVGCTGATMWPFLLPMTIVGTIGGAYIAHALEPTWGEDPKQFVFDELVGVWVAMLFVPVYATTLVASFVLFRVFDIWKPLGIRSFERYGRGWGVMLDDVAAGVAANVCLHIGLLLFDFIMVH